MPMPTPKQISLESTGRLVLQRDPSAEQVHLF